MDLGHNTTADEGRYCAAHKFTSANFISTESWWTLSQPLWEETTEGWIGWSEDHSLQPPQGWWLHPKNAD